MDVVFLVEREIKLCKEMFCIIHDTTSHLFTIAPFGQPSDGASRPESVVF